MYTAWRQVTHPSHTRVTSWLHPQPRLAQQAQQAGVGLALLHAVPPLVHVPAQHTAQNRTQNIVSRL